MAKKNTGMLLGVVAGISLLGWASGGAGAKNERRLPELKVSYEGEVRPWTEQELYNNPMNFQFAIVSDRCGGMRPGVFEDAVKRLNLLSPEFVISVGDLIPGYTENVDQMKREWNEFDSLVDKLGMRFFYVFGNHDLSNGAMKGLVNERYGAVRYYFTYGDVLFLCLDSQDPPRHAMGAEQVKWVKKVLDAHRKVRWTLVFLHTPFWHHDPVPDTWARIEELLEGRSHTVFAGHEHHYSKRLKNDNKYFVLATTGGGSQLTGRKTGEFDHMVWVTMADEGPVVTNLFLEGVTDEDLTEDAGAAYRRLKQGYKVEMSPVFLEGERPKSLKTQVTLTNGADDPIEVSLAWRKHSDFRPQPRKMTKKVDANSVVKVDWELPSRRPVDAVAFGPLILEHKATMTLPRLGPMTVEGTLIFGFDEMHFCPRIAKAPVIDGKLEDWGELQFDGKNPREVSMIPSTWHGPEDAEFDFGVGYDDKFLYVGVRARDDERTAKDRQLWQNDAILIRVEPADRQARAERMVLSKEGKGFMFGMTPYGDFPDYYATSMPKGAKWACVLTDTGLAAELAIPRSEIKSKEFHLNVGQIDTDGEEDWGTLLYWRPNDAANDFPGSAMFTFK